MPTKIATLIGPPDIPYEGLISDTSEQLAIGFGRGYFSVFQNMRCNGSQASARLGALPLIIAFPSGCTSAIDMWAGSLNGVDYVVAAFGDSTNTRIYVCSTYTSWTELTQSTGYDGNTRFSGVATRVAFGVCRSPRSIIAVPTANRDFLVISDGSTVRIYDPSGSLSTTLWKHQALTLATNVDQFFQLATFRNYLHMAETTGSKTYISGITVSPAVNTARQKFSESATSPYNSGSNYVPLYTVASSSSAVGDVASFALTNSGTYMNAQMMFVWEMSATNIALMVQQNKLQISPNTLAYLTLSAATNATPIVVTTNTHGLSDGDQVTISGVTGNTNANGSYYAKVTSYSSTTFALYTTSDLTTAVVGNGSFGGTAHAEVNWKTIYDPSDTAYQTLITTQGLDATPARTLLAFSIAHLGTNVLVRNIRLVRTAVSLTSYTGYLLMVASAGNWKGSTGFGVSYTASHAYSESGGYVTSKEITATIDKIGGPSLVTMSPNNVGAPFLPLVTDQIYYDYDLNVKLATGSFQTTSAPGFAGSLNGLPDSVNFYVRPPDNATGAYQYWTTQAILGDTSNYSGGGPGWTYSFTSANAVYHTSDYSSIAGVAFLDGRRTLPTVTTIPIPPANSYRYAYNRLIAGAPYVEGSLPSEAWFSQDHLPWRFMPEPIDRNLQQDGSLGGRIILPGESVQAITGNASGEGYVSAYILTDKTFVPIGNIAGVGQSFTAARLSSPSNILPHGTLSPRSPIECLGQLFWIDQNGHIIRYTLSMYGGQIQNISLQKVEERITSIPSGRIGQVTGSTLGNRVYFGYTQSGSTNSNCLVFNVVKDMFEADDLAPSTWDYLRLVKVHDSSKAGAGQRLIGLSSTGKLFGYEESLTTEFDGTSVAISLSPGTYRSLTYASIGCIGVTAKKDAGNLTIARSYLETLSAPADTTLALVDPKVPTAAYISVTDPKGDKSTSGRRLRVTVSGSVSPGWTLDMLTVEVDEQTNPPYKRAS